MPLTQEQFEKHIAAAENNLKEIHEAIIVKYGDAQLDIKGYKMRANVLGEYSIKLSEEYFKQARKLEENSKEPYVVLEYQNEKNELVQEKLHRKACMRYDFAAKFDENYPNYNMQKIYRKKHNNTFITAGEGPDRQGAAVRMLYDACMNDTQTIYALGARFDASHFDYYSSASPQKFSATFFNDQQCEIEITSERINDKNDDYVNEYLLTIKISGDEKTHSLKVVNIKIPDREHVLLVVLI